MYNQKIACFDYIVMYLLCRYEVKNTVSTVEENGDPAIYIVNFTVPFTCEYICHEKRHPCTVYIDVLIPESGSNSAETTTCQKGDESAIVFTR